MDSTQIESLLGRKPLSININEIGKYLTNKRILVSGAGGSIGSEICRQVASLDPKELILLGRGENSIFEIYSELSLKFPNILISPAIGDIRDLRRMKLIFAKYEPNIIFHTAAHKHVPLMENAPDEAFLNNVIGTKHLIKLSELSNVESFILISSDKAVKPTNVMGASKRIAEMILQDAGKRNSKTNFIAVRFGNVLGSRGSVVSIFEKQILAGGPVTVTHKDMERYFMTIPEAVGLVIEAGANGQNGEVHFLDMGEPIKIIDLAKRMIKFLGFEPNIDIKIVGIRPGEKLSEELKRDGIDDVNFDRKDRIWLVNCPMMKSDEFQSVLFNMENMCLNGELEKLSSTMKELSWWKPTN